ncbi:MAG: response regulator, partial [Anaerolineae bacterium]|nr:response regulator [Anaerolineae bacterium]
MSMTHNRGGVLLVDPDQEMRETLQGTLEQEGYLVIVTAGGEGALERLGDTSFDVMLTELNLPD